VVTCYPNTRCTRNWAPSQSIASWTSPKRCRKLSSRTIASHAARQNLAPDCLAGITHRQAPRPCRLIFAPSPPGGHTFCRRAPRGSTAWRICLAPPGATEPPRFLLHYSAWRNPLYRQALCAHCDHCHRLVFCPPGGSPTPPGAIPVAQCYWFFGTLTDSPKDPNHIAYKLVVQLLHSSHNSILNYKTFNPSNYSTLMTFQVWLYN